MEAAKNMQYYLYARNPKSLTVSSPLQESKGDEADSAIQIQNGFQLLVNIMG